MLVNKRITLLLLVLLVEPLTGFGQQAVSSSLESLVTAARIAQTTGDYAAAASEYKEAVKVSPAMPELWANLGLMQHEAGDVGGAILSFQHANRLNPSLYVPNLFLGIDYQRTGKTNEAIPLLIKAEKINKSDPQAPLALGRAYVSERRFAAAAEELDRATTLDPKLAAAWFTEGIARLDQVEADAFRMSSEAKDSPFAGALYADSLLKQGRFTEAASLYKSLLNEQIQPPCLRPAMGFALLRGHDPEGAATAFAEERIAHPECGMAMLGQARLAIEHGEQGQAAKLLAELWKRDHGYLAANSAILVEGLPEEAARSVNALLSDEAVTPELRKALLASFENYDRPAENLNSADNGSAAPHAPSDARTPEQLYAAGEFQACAQHLASKLAVLKPEKLRLLVACSFYTGNNELAYKAATAMQKTPSHSLEALYWIIQSNEHLAFEELARFQMLEPDSARSHVLLGDMFEHLDRYESAESEYQKALAIAPSDLAAMVGLASAYLSDNKMKEARAITTAALAQTPDDPELNLIMADIKITNLEYDTAGPYLEKSLNAKPQIIPRVHALMGKVYAETGRVEDAIRELKLGASCDEDGSIAYLLARLYRKTGDTQAANEALERMKTIKAQRREKGVKSVQDPDLSPLESPPGATP